MGGRRRNTTFSLSSGDVTIEGNSNLLARAADIYKNLFDPADGNLCSLADNV